MTSEIARTIATSAVWISTAIILAFGLFRMNGPIELFLFGTLFVMLGATASTAFIWLGPKIKDMSARGFDVVMPAQPVEKD